MEQQSEPKRQQGVGSPSALLTQQEAEALLEAADATHGPAAAAAAAWLLPYPELRRPRLQQLLLAVGGSDSAADLAAALPGLAALLVLLVQRQPALFVELAAGEPDSQVQLQRLVSAALLQQRSDGSGYSQSIGANSGLSLCTALTAAAAAEVAAAAGRLVTGAADGGVPSVDAPFAAAELLRALPDRCSAALEQLACDM